MLFTKVIKTFKVTLCFCFFLFISFQVYAVTVFPKDSIGIERTQNKSFILHKVEAKETFYSLSRKYKVNVKEIQAANPGISTLNIGETVRIPYVEKSSNAVITIINTPEKPASQHKTHIVEVSETLYAISRRYGITVDDIKTWNNLTSNDINVGQELIIADPREAIKKTEDQAVVKNTKEDKKADKKEKQEKSEKQEKQDMKKEALGDSGKQEKTEKLPEGAMIHMVEMAQTLYSIARSYEVSTDEIKAWNNLNSNDLSVGQRLVILKSKEVAPAEIKRIDEKEKFEDYNASMKKIVKAEISSDFKPEEKSTHSHKKIVESGLAEVIEGASDSQKFLALHRTAPIGTIMQVKNEMNNLSVFVRVVGKLPDTGVNDKVVLKISKTAFEKLNAVDSRFRVEVSYVP